MTITIYDYDDRAKEIEIPANDVKDIDLIVVTVLSGDETGEVILKNGECVYFDAFSEGLRNMNFYDGTYIVRKTKKLKQWLDFKPSGERTASYERQELFE